MFTFTKLPVCVVILALLCATSIQGAPIDIQEIVESIIEEIKSPHETSDLAAAPPQPTGPLKSDVEDPSVDTAGGIYTIITSIGGPALTLQHDGSTTVWGTETYVINPPAASSGAKAGDDSNSDPGDSDPDSASASGADSASATPSSTASDSASAPNSSQASSVSDAATSASSSAASKKPNAGTALQPVKLSTPLARGLLTVAVGVFFGAWCI
ncbi:hypothetical protein C8J57DRAFT_1284955 [Mycena rebaudengoi]|nr:hypothetical protein C8J57DRAFT_1284955 [Mycena rebaudengoi]